MVQEEEDKTRDTAQLSGYTNFLDNRRIDNEALSVLGNHVLGVLALEWLENRYPHLPERSVLPFLKFYLCDPPC